MTAVSLSAEAIGLAAPLGVEPATLGEALARMGSPEFGRWSEQVVRAGCCSNPIRLTGSVVRDGRVTFSTATEPDGVLLKACGNRRAAVCPSCSYRYAGDMWQLLYAGIVGGCKDVSASVGTHPMVFATLTAPSFGAVHAHRDGQPCRPRRTNPTCEHGQPVGCRRIHADGDDLVGTPLCVGCYDYEGAVLFNWTAPELWRLFTIRLRRELAAALGLTERKFAETLVVSYAKVAEFQRRGLVHFHAIIRLDAKTEDAGDPHRPPPIDIPIVTLTAAIEAAAAHVSTDHETTGGGVVELRFGDQVDVAPIHDPNGEVPVTPEVVAAYVAKYSTKAAEDFGLSGRPVTPDGARYLGASSHVVSMIDAATRLAREVDGLARLERWTHMLGFRGHFASKSRRYSTTLGALRAARTEHQRRLERIRHGLDPDDPDDTTLVIADWQFAGRGYETSGDALLAASAAARARDRRTAAHDARRTLEPFP